MALLPGGGGSGRVQKFFCRLTQVFDIQFKNTSNLIFLGFMIPSKRILKQVLIFATSGFKNSKIESEAVNISVGHSIQTYIFFLGLVSCWELVAL